MSRRFVRLGPDAIHYKDEDRCVEIPYASIEHVRRAEMPQPGSRATLPYYRVEDGASEIAFGKLGVLALRDFRTEDRDHIPVLDILDAERIR